MDHLEKYKEYRETLIKLHSKILDECVNADDFNKSTEIIGIVKNNQVILGSNYEEDAILDFNVYENIKNGENAVSEYIERKQGTTSQEDELLTAMEKSKTGLYQVIESDEDKGMVTLKDIVSDSEDDIFTIIDVGLSKGSNNNIIVFTRLIHLEEYSMTSGLGFIFSMNHKQYLLKRSRKLMKKINSGDASIDRFIAFFFLNRSDGLPTLFGKVN